MNPTRTFERVELALIGLVCVVVAVAGARFGGTYSLGELVLYGAAALLAQSLVRDLWLLSQARKAEGSGQPRKARCMCIESTIGMAGVLAGGLLMLAGIGPGVTLGAVHVAAGLGLILIGGFLVKDWVFTWSPFRLLRDPDHINIVVTLRKD